MNKLMILGVCVAGIGMIVLIGGFAYDLAFAGIPYQDPTPQMQARYDSNLRVAEIIEQIGGVTFASGIPILIVGLVRRKLHAR